MEKKEHVSVGDLLPNKYEPQRAFRFVMELKDAKTGKKAVDSYLIKSIMTSPPDNYLWFQMYVSEHADINDAMALHGQNVVAKIKLMSSIGVVTNTMFLKPVTLRMLPVSFDYSDAEPLVLTFVSE